MIKDFVISNKSKFILLNCGHFSIQAFKFSDIFREYHKSLLIIISLQSGLCLDIFETHFNDNCFAFSYFSRISISFSFDSLK